MIYLLDTNVCITLLRAQNALLAQRLQACHSSDVALCSIVIAELCYGAYLSNQPAIHLASIHSFAQPYACIPFENAAAKEFGSLRAYLKQLGKPIGPYDLMIASIALSNSVTLVTHNTVEFSRVPNLKLVDWQIP